MIGPLIPKQTWPQADPTRVTKHLKTNAIYYPRAARWARRATHLVYKYFAKTTDLCGENSPRTAIRITVLIRPLQFRYVRVPLDSIAKLCIRKDNIASLTCLMTYSHELQLYAGIYSPTEPKTTLYTCRYL